MTLAERILTEIEAHGPATATKLAAELGHDRTYITKILLGSEIFMGVREGKEMLYHLRPRPVAQPIVQKEMTYDPEPEPEDSGPILPF